jgi:SNF2 family DNA or RNA helicase
VTMCTFVDVSDGERSGDSHNLEEQFRESRRQELETMQRKAIGYEKTVKILKRTRDELERELVRLIERGNQGDTLACTEAEGSRMALGDNERDLTRALQILDTQREHIRRCEASETFVRERLSTLEKQSETCPICMERVSGAITPCAHIFCSKCIRKHIQSGHGFCPTCRMTLSMSDLTGVTLAGGIGTKMTQIGELVASLGSIVPIVLFVQWKVMMRGVRAVLRGSNVKVFMLEGNVHRRASTLGEFASGGVLLLCLEDSFAGLHLPHVRHVIFAHAIVGDKATVEHLERQAIGRCVRTGQTEEVHIYSFIVADCEEEWMWRRTHT